MQCMGSILFLSTTHWGSSERRARSNSKPKQRRESGGEQPGILPVIINKEPYHVVCCNLGITDKSLHENKVARLPFGGIITELYGMRELLLFTVQCSVFFIHDLNARQSPVLVLNTSVT